MYLSAGSKDELRLCQERLGDGGEGTTIPLGAAPLVTTQGAELLEGQPP